MTERDSTGTSVALAVADEPIVVDWPSDDEPDEIRETVLYIVEPAAGNRVVTAIEVLSPSNKEEGPGRYSYLNKQQELWEAGTNLVEIDLLRAGRHTIRLPGEQLARVGPHEYLIAVSRAWPMRGELYGARLREPLPAISIPLARGDRDVALELQSAFTRCWDTGPYPELPRYDADPPGELDDDARRWCRETAKRYAA